MDRRAGIDRRNPKTGIPLKYLINGRRREVRRQTDKGRIVFLDRYGEIDFILILLILLFCIMDAFFTLILVDHGARELNPLMAFYLTLGPTTFVSVKYTLTGASVLLLIVYSHNNIKHLKIEMRILFPAITFAYSGVLWWHFYLFYHNVF